MNGGAIFAGIIGLICLAIGLSFLMALPVMWIWNWAIVGTIAGISTITFWKAWCIMFLCQLLFKGSCVNTKSKD